MNGKMVRYILGRMLGVEALLLLLPAFVGILYGEEKEALTFVIPAVILTCIFVIAGRKRPEGQVIYGKEGMVVVASAWITWSLFGALPFTLSGSIPNFVDAFFETVSGFTTTGSSILRDVEALPQCMLFWRSFTHWIGGMGVLVFVLMLTNLDKKNSMYLMRAEVPGPEKDKLVPKTKTTARILYGIYFGLTLILVILLMFGGMNLFDSLIHAFGSAGTGGFSNYADSVGHFDSAYIDYVISIFMILFGINFNFYFLLLMRKPRKAMKNEEVRCYLAIIAITISIITFNIRGLYPSIMEAFQQAAFQVGSIITTTGFATTDFNTWPQVSRTILVMLMFVGACAGSTGGGIKVSRFVILLKTVNKELHLFLHPKGVRKISMDGKVVEHEVVRSTNVFMTAYVLVFAFSILLVGFDNHDLITNFTAVAATLNNIGPGLELVGPSQNFGLFSDPAKCVLIFDMLAGRLELFPLLLLFVKDTWKRF